MPTTTMANAFLCCCSSSAASPSSTGRKATTVRTSSPVSTAVATLKPLAFQNHRRLNRASSPSFPRSITTKYHPLVLAQRQMGRRATKREIIIPEPDYRIPAVLLGLAGISLYEDNLLAAAPIGLLGLLLLFQTTRVRFVFDDEALEVKVGEQLQDSGENVFVGGKNRWKYSTFVNWELWWPNFPILVYFKERQTKPEGQVHFFPVIFNGRQLYDVMVERAGPSQTSGPKGL